jgi:hypothetical protein
MTTQHLLPCSCCGAKTPVDLGQAGETVVCQCGATLNVPTMRQLGALETLETVENKTVGAATEWGARQGILLLAAVVTVVAGIIGGTLWFVHPAPPERDTQAVLRAFDEQIKSMTPLQTWELWQDQILKEGLVQYEDPAQMAYHARKATRQRWSKVALTVAGCGLMTLLATLLLAGDPGR